jgi:hypothetical protein
MYDGVEKTKMTQMILKLKENEQVCKFCNIAEGVFLITFPLALPVLIIFGATL